MDSITYVITICLALVLVSVVAYFYKQVRYNWKQRKQKNRHTKHIRKREITSS